MNFRQAETFVTVLNTGSLSRAAEILGVSQPAISRGISEFERSVGFPLFARVRNRLVPTPEARLLYRDVDTVFRSLDAARASASRIRDRGTGEVRFASLSAASYTIGAKAVRIFREKHPDIRLTFHVMHSRDVRDLVASGEFDVGLTADLVDTTGVVSQSFVNRDALCVLPAGHPLAKKKTITPTDLHEEPFIAYLPEDHFRKRIDAAFHAAGAEPKIVIETPHAPAAIALVAQGVGITLASAHAAALFHPSQVVVKPFRPSIKVVVLLLLPADRPKSLLVRDFVHSLMLAR
ncbi:LysR substrate-binding domain-containing protein [Mesorhizobium temperatum]|uniref:LysR family transcriptional regulator n=1 Tax=Mesorhizobium temperatum TaxID=241416 RepID=A0A271LG78_9HYPH|nr:LysR substrate-binding domain-containing protein [Mesorhizobium temperatum]PAQ07099.1 LysR family transcriptional regulator [Mesorhizobium temperatum]